MIEAGHLLNIVIIVLIILNMDGDATVVCNLTLQERTGDLDLRRNGFQ